MIITIDGPTASGKSTVARAVAHRLGLFYIASGSLFRGLAYVLLRECGYRLDTLAHVREEDIIMLLDSRRYNYLYTSNEGEQIFFDGTNITSELRQPVIDSAASLVGTNLLVRKHLLNFQRNLANSSSVIVDGRDCGSVVFPHAEVKFFLTASLEVRSRRWQTMQRERGHHVGFDEAQCFIAARDKRDSEREIAPLVVPIGALVIDASEMSQQEVTAHIESLVHKNTVWAMHHNSVHEKQ